MKKFNSNTQLVQLIFDKLKEILELTLLIREMIVKEELETLPEHLSRREHKIEELSELLKEFKKVKDKTMDPQRIRLEINAILDEVLKIDAENADNIREKMKRISEELNRLIERRKILNYLR